MTKLHRFTLSVIAALAFAAIGTASASATTDTATLTINGGTPCAIEYDYGSTIPGSGSLTNLVNPNACTDVNVVNAQSSLTLSFAGSVSSGTAALSGVLGITVGGPFFGCKFSTAASGSSGPFTGTYTGANYSVSASLVKKSGSFGFFGCPGSVPDLINATVSGTINP